VSTVDSRGDRARGKADAPLVTYHRFLRFYADGSVISFLTTDHPSDVVPTLNRSIRGKGLHFGRWRLVRSDAEEEDEDNVGPDEGVKKGEKGEEGEKGSTATAAKPGAKPAPRHARILLTDLVEPGALHPKYEFEMDITLRQTHRGRWNKLDIARYSTVNIATGELLHLSLRHQKPFYFSK
jgi:F-box protein 9